VARDGWIYVVAVKGAVSRRLVRGSEPAWSPDGSAIAYIGAEHRVYVERVDGGKPRPVGHVRARAVEWRPLPIGSSQTCGNADGVVVATSGLATVRSSLDVTEEHIGWNGCLTALGRPVHLTDGPAAGGTSLTLERVALSGPMAALEFDDFDKEYGGYDLVDVYDLRTGMSVGASTLPCLARSCTVDRLLVNSSGELAWHRTDVPEPPLQSLSAISCPTASLCVAVDQSGNVAVSTEPTGGRSAWQLANIDGAGGALAGVSCPSAGLCIATDFGGRVLTSTDPTGGLSAWNAAAVTTNGLNAVSCPSISLCVAVDRDGDVFASQDPTVGAASWTLAASEPGDDLTGVSCPSLSLCVAVDNAGDAVVSTNPSSGAAAWSAAKVDLSPYRPALSDVACPNESLCVASVQDYQGGDVLVSTQPTGGAGACTLEHVDGRGELGSVTCASASLCIGFDQLGDAVSSTDPAGGAATWTATKIDDGQTDASCPTTDLCIGVSGPAIVSSTTPSQTPGLWNGSLVDSFPCAVSTPCLSEQIYTHDPQGTQLIDSAPPGSGTTLSQLRLTGGTLSWIDNGTPRSVILP